MPKKQNVAHLKKAKSPVVRSSAQGIEKRLNQKILGKLNVDLKQALDLIDKENIAMNPKMKEYVDTIRGLANVNPYDSNGNGKADKVKEGAFEGIDLTSNALAPNAIPLILESTGLVAKSAAMTEFMETFGASPKKLNEKTYDKEDLARIAKKAGVPVSDVFVDPYDDVTKWRHHDALRVDLTSVSAFEVKAQFIGGSDLTDVSLDTNRTWPSKEDEQKEIELINKHPLYQRIREELKLIDQDVDFNEWLVAWLINRMGYGKACLLIQDDKDNELPIALKMLASMRIGKIFTSELDWRPVAIEYLDYKKPKNILYKEDFIFDANRNYHQSPGSLNYGFADSELFQHIVELNIIINAMDLKEINKRLWAAMILIHLATENANDLTKFKDKLMAAGSVISALDFNAQQIQFNHDGEFILKERESNALEITRGANVPKQFVGLGGTLTKSEASIVAHAWNQGPLSKERLHVRLVFEKQWYGRNALRLIKNICLEAGLDYDALQKKELPSPKTKEAEFDLLVHKKEFTKIPKDIEELKDQLKELARAKTLKELPFKVKMDIVPISYETDIERAAVVDIMLSNGSINIMDGLEYMKWDKVAQRKKKELAKKGLTPEDLQFNTMGMDPNDPNGIPTIKNMVDKQNQKQPFGRDEEGKVSTAGITDAAARVKRMVTGKQKTGTEKVEIGQSTA